MKLKNTLLVVALIVLGVLTRILPHPSNFTALGAVALFAMTLISSRPLGLILPLLALFVSDLWIGFHTQIGWVYGSFAMIAMLSLWIEPARSWGRNITGALVASLLFFLITNFGVWAEGTMYSMDFNGLMDSYVAGLPFLKNQIAGDLFYSVAFGLVIRAFVTQPNGKTVRA